MKTVQFEGIVLTADLDARTVTGRILPYGEPGRTSLGLVTASKGAIQLPADLSKIRLNLEHDRKRPIGRLVNVDDQDDGLVGTFSIANTRDGDDYLVEVADGLRPGLSVETENTVIKNGQLVAGQLSWVGGVTVPAFPSALLTAADTDPESEPEPESEPSEIPPPIESPTQEGETPVNTTTTTPTTDAAQAPATGLFASTPPTPASDLASLVAAMTGAQSSRTMLAALADIIPANILGTEQPQAVGELWDGKGFERKIVPLFNHADLTSFKVRGWKWETKPEVAEYAGNKAAIPSNAVATVEKDVDVTRIAGGHDIDRKFVDFKDDEFLTAYFRAMTESYARVSDTMVLADIIGAATAVTRGTVPAGVSAGMTSIVDGTLAVLNATDTMPTFAVVATDLWREIALTRYDDTLAYLSAALNLEEGTVGAFKIVPSSALTAGSVLVGNRSAATVHELAGSPIRVEAQNIAQGGVDYGLFGYIAVNVHDAAGLALVTAA